MTLEQCHWHCSEFTNCPGAFIVKVKCQLGCFSEEIVRY